jgi:hypothetical protein
MVSCVFHTYFYLLQNVTLASSLSNATYDLSSYGRGNWKLFSLQVNWSSWNLWIQWDHVCAFCFIFHESSPKHTTSATLRKVISIFFHLLFLRLISIDSRPFIQFVPLAFVKVDQVQFAHVVSPNLGVEELFPSTPHVPMQSLVRVMITIEPMVSLEVTHVIYLTSSTCPWSQR